MTSSGRNYEEKITGEIQEISRSDLLVVFKWTAGQDASCYTCVCSPLFEAMNNTWCILFYPRGRDGKQSYTGIALRRTRISSIVVKFEINISTGNTNSSNVICDIKFPDQSYSLYVIPELRNIPRAFYSFGPTINQLTVACSLYREEYPSVRVDPTLQKHLKDLLLASDSHDVTIKVGDKKFNAHKCILEARSTVFAAMFKHDMKERTESSVSIDDCDPEAFGEFLIYVYTGKVENLTPGKASALYYAGDKYDFSELKELCVQFLESSLSKTSVCDIIDLARRHDENSLLERAINFFSENVKEILPTVEWQRFAANNFVVANELFLRAIKSFDDKNLNA